MNTNTTPSIGTPIGARPLSLATHLRRAVDLLLDTTTPEAYDWGDCGVCNCGMLARAVTGLSASEVKTATISRWQPMGWGAHKSAWQLMEDDGIEDPIAIRAQLLAAGMLPTDFRHLELLNCPELAKPDWDLTQTAGSLRSKKHFEIADNAAYYLLAWARAIEAHHAALAAESAAPESTIAPQVPAAITEPVLA